MSATYPKELIMRILVIGATGTIGRVVADALQSRGHDVVSASRSTSPAVDVTDPDSISALFDSVGSVDSVIVAVGSVPFKPLTELTRDDYIAGFTSKTLGQIEVVRQALERINDAGSVTLTTGVLAREPIAQASAAAMDNGALESFVITCAAEAPRGIRINAVSPDVLASAPALHAMFPGHRPVTDDEVARAYVRSVEGVITGSVITV